MARSKTSRATTGKILAFDLETSNLAANRGHIICAAAKWVGKNQEMMTWRIDEAEGYRMTAASFFNDSHIIKALIPLLEEADAVMAYYGTGFDVPYVNTRAIIHKIVPPGPFTVIDPWQTASRHLKLARNDMGSVATLVGAKHQKTHLPWQDWLHAQFGDSKAISKLLVYNKNDVLALEDVYFGIRPIMRNHPYLGYNSARNGTLRCPACGSAHTHSRGSRFTRTFEIFRRRCSVCDTSFEGGRRKIA